MENYNSYFEQNRELWDKRTPVHKSSDFYDLEGFLSGKPSLRSIELSELGDVSGKNLLHLQCHFGMDSLDWARRGARVTGIDFSPEAINEARSLNDQIGLDADFICANVYDPVDALKDKFDIVFTSYGVIGWLPDLDKWAGIIASYLKPGGVFYMAEFHPVVWIFDDDFEKIKYSYENREVIVTESKGTYTDRTAEINSREYSWNHSISEVLNALLSAGMQLQFFNEHMFSPYNCFNKMTGEKDKWYIAGLEEKIPMVYSLGAVKQ
jgi:2-polyprenyl-3-methyl-5-hydroxy-6-metoxy-1,4-benzoquinol methylase